MMKVMQLLHKNIFLMYTIYPNNFSNFKTSIFKKQTIWLIPQKKQYKS